MHKAKWEIFLALQLPKKKITKVVKFETPLKSFPPPSFPPQILMLAVLLSVHCVRICCKITGTIHKKTQGYSKF